MHQVSARKYFDGQRVDVKQLRQGKPADWLPGTILDTQRGRAMVRLDRGGEEKAFYYYELRPRDPADDLKPREHAPLTTIGDSAKIAPSIRLAALNGTSHLSPYLDHDQPGANRPPANVPPPPPSGVVSTMTRRPETKPRQRRVHYPTPIGEMFRGFRNRKDQTQPDFASLLKSQPWRLSRIEQGEMVPSDEELLNFSDLAGVDLEKLEAVRDESEAAIRTRKTAVVAPAPAPVAATVAASSTASPQPVPKPAEAPTPSTTATLVSNPPAPSSVDADPEVAFFDFCEELRKVVPPPEGGDERKLWLAMARRFMALRK